MYADLDCEAGNVATRDLEVGYVISAERGKQILICESVELQSRPVTLSVAAPQITLSGCHRKPECQSHMFTYCGSFTSLAE